MSCAIEAMAYRLEDWPEDSPARLPAAPADLLVRVGPSAWPDGQLPLVFAQCDRGVESALPGHLASRLPEAHDLLRLLSLRSGDWSDAGGEFGAGFRGDPAGGDDRTMDLRTACTNALARGDLALADMLLGGWLLARLAAGQAVPHPADVARTLRGIPAEERVSTLAVLGLLVAESGAASAASRQLAGLTTYLPPVPPFAPPDAEAELREHLTEASFAALSAEEARRLLESERLFRDLRRLGPGEAATRGPAVLLTPWAALFETLLRRALRRAHKDLLPQVHDPTTLGTLVPLMVRAWQLAEAEAWSDHDPRRPRLVGEPVLGMLLDLNAANCRVKHPDGTPPGWREVATFRSRLIYGGALQRVLEAAGPSAA
jgi:hypothetical protein